MTKLSRYILVLVGIIASSIVLPQLYWIAFDKPIIVPYVHYSCITDDFTISNIYERTYSDTKGNSFERNHYEELLPLMCTRQLMVDQRFPDTIRGVAYDMHTFAKARSHVRIRPSDISTTHSKLHPLFESESGRVSLEQPDDVFRISWRIEFIDASTNTINEEKSQAYSATLYHKGFQFPAKSISGIPTTRKSCDEGYLIIDSEDQLFHLKMVKSRPFVKKVDIPSSLTFKFIKCVDFKDKLYYAYLISEDNSIYILTQDDYELTKLPISDYVAETDELKMQGDYFNYNINIKGDGQQVSHALDKDFNMVDSYVWEWATNDEKTVGKISASIFPFQLSLTDENSKFIDLYHKGPKGIFWGIINVFFMGIQLILIKKRGIKAGTQIIDIIIVAFTGLFGFIAVNAFPNKF